MSACSRRISGGSSDSLGSCGPFSEQARQTSSVACLSHDESVGLNAAPMRAARPSCGGPATWLHLNANESGGWCCSLALLPSWAGPLRAHLEPERGDGAQQLQQQASRHAARRHLRRAAAASVGRARRQQQVGQQAPHRLAVLQPQ